MRTIKKKACPEVHLLEAYIANQISSISERRKILHHIQSCTRCLALVTELSQYYKILEHERKKPVSSSIFKLIYDIEKENVVIAGILLQPNNIPAHNNSVQYQAEIVAVIQPDNLNQIDDLDCIPIDDEEIFIRAIHSQHTSETTIFLYANEAKLYRNVQLHIKPVDRIFLSDDIGKIELGQFDIWSFDGQHIIITPENSS